MTTKKGKVRAEVTYNLNLLNWNSSLVVYCPSEQKKKNWCIFCFDLVMFHRRISCLTAVILNGWQVWLVEKGLAIATDCSLKSLKKSMWIVLESVNLLQGDTSRGMHESENPFCACQKNLMMWVVESTEDMTLTQNLNDTWYYNSQEL